jgi:RNA polymerase sigma factor (sigma-70 family)
VGSTYGDLFEDWEVDLTKSLVRQFRTKYAWLRVPDFDDLLQECLIQWYLKRDRFGANRGASVKTFMAIVLNTHLQYLLRSQLADRRKISHLAQSLETPIGDTDLTLADVVADGSGDSVDLDVDIRLALDHLSPFQKKICQLLGEGHPVARVARLLGKPRTTVRDEITRIRTVFRQQGLDDY